MELDNVHAQFLITVADACQSAATASLAVDLLLSSGQRIAGVPASVPAGFGDRQVDDTGYADEVAINGTTVALQDIVACTILAPARS